MKEYTFEELSVGLSETFSVQITRELVDDFIRMTGDDNPLHTDPEYCRDVGVRGPIVHGCLLSGFISTLVGTRLPGKYARLSSLTVDWKRPVFAGDTVAIQGTVAQMSEALKVVVLKLTGTSQDGVKVFTGSATVGLLK